MTVFVVCLHFLHLNLDGSVVMRDCVFNMLIMTVVKMLHMTAHLEIMRGQSAPSLLSVNQSSLINKVFQLSIRERFSLRSEDL